MLKDIICAVGLQGFYNIKLQTLGGEIVDISAAAAGTDAVRVSDVALNVSAPLLSCRAVIYPLNSLAVPFRG